jgi:hypothetical protein
MITTERKKVTAILVHHWDLTGCTLKQLGRDVEQYSAEIEALGGSNAYFENFGENRYRLRYSRWETDVEWRCRVMAEYTAFKDATKWTKQTPNSELQAARDEIRTLKAVNKDLQETLRIVHKVIRVKE